MNQFINLNRISIKFFLLKKIYILLWIYIFPQIYIIPTFLNQGLIIIFPVTYREQLAQKKKEKKRFQTRTYLVAFHYKSLSITYLHSSNSVHKRRLAQTSPPRGSAYSSALCPWPVHSCSRPSTFSSASSSWPLLCYKFRTWSCAAAETSSARSIRNEYYIELFRKKERKKKKRRIRWCHPTRILVEAILLTCTTLVSFSRFVSRGTSRSTQNAFS